MSIGSLVAPGFPEAEIRLRAREGIRATLPIRRAGHPYGQAAFGQVPTIPADPLDRKRIVPNVLLPSRLAKLIELGREPQASDVDLSTSLGGFQSSSPYYVSALGSTGAAHSDAGLSLAKQAGARGLPLVLGENIGSTHGYRARARPERASFVERAGAYASSLPPRFGGLVVQQSVEDANAELWNEVYSDPTFEPLLATGRLGFELKLGQGAKPGLGGMSLVSADEAKRLRDRFGFASLDLGDGTFLRLASAGTFTDEILHQQIRLMRNNYPRARIWVKLPPTLDVADAAKVAWEAGAHAVIVDGAEGGTGLGPSGFLNEVGLPLADCLERLRPHRGRPLLASGRMWEGTRVLKTLALGAQAVGLGRAALLAAHEDLQGGLGRFLDALDFELRLLASALGKYSMTMLSPDDLWTPS